MAGEAQQSRNPCAHSDTMSAAGLLGLGNVASFRMQVSRMDFKIRFGATECQTSAFGLHKLDRLLVGHVFTGVAFVRLGQCQWEAKLQHLPANYCRCIHGGKVSLETDLIKRRMLMEKG